MSRLLKDTLSVDRLAAEVVTPEAGAVATFLGVVRNHHEGRGVLRLYYESMPGMAEKVMDEIEAETVRRFVVTRCRIEHRVGDLAIGEASVAIAVSSPHRADAIRACHWAIDTLKQTVPIWKKEYFADGTVEWVKGCEAKPVKSVE
ncbi:MAG: molybdenum cofactor biosynthesis protein MoaE [Deltaproteobacteria bacterium]|nr:molybdenum cofactor biosynthesis protein MoaE [Deltaproteobacteria bacterium]